DDDLAQPARRDVGVALEGDLGEHAAELAAELGWPCERQLVGVELGDHARRLGHLVRGGAAQRLRPAGGEGAEPSVEVALLAARGGHDRPPRSSAERPWPSSPSHAASAAIVSACAAAAVASYSISEVRLRKSCTPSGEA